MHPELPNLSTTTNDIISSPTFPICEFPDDILGEIFLRSEGLSACSPRMLAKVCRKWYQVALDTPRLWAHIYIKSLARRGLNPYLDRSEPVHETCSSLTELEQTLSRAKNAPLYIQRWGDFDWKVVGPQFFQRLFSPEITSQMKHLNLGYSFDIPEDIIDWSKCNFSSLYSLECHSPFPCFELLLQVLDKTASKLKEINFTPRASTIVLKNIWPNLTRLSLGRAIDIIVDSIIPRCKSLQFLAANTNDWPTAATPPILFAELDWGLFQCSNLLYMTSLQFPRLTRLHLAQGGYHRNDDPTTVISQLYNITIHLPELTYLSLNGSIAWLAPFRAPKLEKITYNSHHPTPGWDDASFNLLSITGALSSFPLFESLQVLSLTSGASDSAIVKILPLFPNISEFYLSFNNHKPPKEFGQLIMKELTATTSRADILLPKLRILEWGDYHPRLCLEEIAVTQKVQCLFAARRKCGLQLNKVKAYITAAPEDHQGKELEFTQDSFADLD